MQTNRLILRDWVDDDFAAFYRLNNDAKIMKFFPSQLTQQQAYDKFLAIRKMNETNLLTIYALQEKKQDKVIGICGLTRVNLPTIMPLSSVEILWRILPEFQRQGFAFEAAQYIINYGFEQLNLQEIIAFTASVNLPSIGLMQKLGMQEFKQKTFMHPKVPDSHFYLKKHVIYQVQNNMNNND